MREGWQDQTPLTTDAHKSAAGVVRDTSAATQSDIGRVPGLARRSRPGNTDTSSDTALAVLGAWQVAGCRGYTVVEKRADRRLVVLTLIAQLQSEQIAIEGLILAADEVARDQWRDLLVRGGELPRGWAVETSEALLADGGRAKENCIVVADELEAYLTEDLAAALKEARGIIGLCALPRGLGDAVYLRRYVGQVLDVTQPRPALDFSVLIEERQPGVDRDFEDHGYAPEKLLTVKSPENLLGYYLTEIQKFPLLAAEEEIELAKRIEVGLYATQKMAELIASGQKLPVQQRRDMQWICRDGQRAKNLFITSNLRLVYSIARKYSGQMEIMDAIQEGNLGLIHSVEKFDYAKGFKFSTYATWWIRQAITRAIADQSRLIRIPVHLVESDAPILKEWRRRASEGQSTRPADIASALGLSSDDVESAIDRHRRPDSLEAMADQGIDIMDPDDRDSLEQVNFELLQDQLQSVLETLSEREAGVVRLRFGLIDGKPRTLEEIGQIYNLTRERIRQIETKCMSKLRHRSRSQVLRGYLAGTPDPELVEEDSPGPELVEAPDPVE